MKPISSTRLRIFALAALLTASLAIHAQTSSSDFAGEPDQSMAAAHESFVKGDMTAAESQKAGQDAGAALKQAGAALDGAAKWSGNKLQEGAQASIDSLKKVGAGVQTGAGQVGQWFQGIGEGIKDLGQKL